MHASAHIRMPRICAIIAFMEQQKITLNDMLMARDARNARESELLARFSGHSLVVFTIVWPGETKRCAETDALFSRGTTELGALLTCMGGAVFFDTRELPTGNEAYALVNADAFLLKRRLCALESAFPFGRLWDMDVVAPDHTHISREDLHFAERGCIVCGASGRGCASRRLHSLFDTLSAARRLAAPVLAGNPTEPIFTQARYSSAEAAFRPLCRRIEALAERNGRTLVAIDGLCAAGKSTLASRLGERLSCPVLHMDDFFLPPAKRTEARLTEAGGNVDRERFLSEVLSPLSRGDAFDYTRYDCHTDALFPPVRYAPPRLALVEGAYALHPLLAPYYDLSVFLSVSPIEQLSRIRARNGEEAVKRFSSVWIPLENAYFAAYPIEQTCDVVIGDPS